MTVLGESSSSTACGLSEVLASLGRAALADGPPRAISIDEWFERAADRPAWLLWGKAQPVPGGCPAHPLLCHMADVAAVAGRMITRTVPTAVRRRLLKLDGLSEEEALRFLLFVVALHDLGKASPDFQAKAKPWAREELPRRGLDLDARDRIQHSIFGIAPARDVIAELGVARTVALVLARAVTAHHGEFPTNRDLARSEDPGSREAGVGPRWREARDGVVSELRAIFRVERGPTCQELDHAYVALLAGLTAVADWIGSKAEVFEYVAPPESLAAYWPTALERADEALARVHMSGSPPSVARTFSGLFPQFEKPWPLHLETDRIAGALTEPSLLVIEAPMGEGKTEASLLLAQAADARLGCDGLYVGLPTQATANQMLGRVRRFLESTRPGEDHNLLLAHGEASLVPAFQQIAGVHSRDRLGSVRAEEWFLTKKRKLLARHAVGTIDQALLGVMHVAHAFVRLFGLAGKTVVLDEVHAYDTYTGRLLARLVEWLAAEGAMIVLLSATLPASKRAELVRAYQRGAGVIESSAAPDVNYPRITEVSRAGARATTFAPRGASVAVALARASHDIGATAAAVTDSAANGGCIGWICNTVARAQTAYEEVRRLAPDLPMLLLHSRLFPTERSEREARLEEWLGPPARASTRPERCIVIGTQVLEQSLDVDFDRLFTDVAPIDLLLQRAGRLHRHQRTNRSAAHSTPALVVLAPEGDPHEVPLDDVARVYAELLVRRTLHALEGRTTIVLPGDIENLVEQIYSDAVPPADDDLYGRYIEYHGGRAAQGQLAEGKLLDHPDKEDDPFADFRVRLDDDEDPALHRALRADTRLGPPSVEIVCLARGDMALLDTLPDRDLTKRFVLRSIGVTRRAVVHALLGDPSASPKTWAENALLRHRRVVVFDDDRAAVGGIALRLDVELGLVIGGD